MEGALIRAVRTGRLGFEDLKRVALSALAEIAAAAIHSGIGAILGGGGVGKAAACSARSAVCSAACSARRARRSAARSRPAGPSWSASAARNCSCQLRAEGSRRAPAAGRATSA